MIKRPIISVIIPTFNRLSVVRSVLSCMEQGFADDDMEIIVLDDCSDALLSDRVCGALREVGSNVTYLRFGENRGPGVLRNEGICRALGKFICFLDSDDFWGAGALSSAVSVAEEDGSDVVVCLKAWLNGRISEAASTQTAHRGSGFFETAAIHTLTPQAKIFSTELVMSHSLKFSDTRRWGEDQPFILGAYLVASKISVLRERIFCHLGVDGASLTLQDIPPTDYLNTFIDNIDCIKRAGISRRVQADLIALNFKRTAFRAIKKWGHPAVDQCGSNRFLRAVEDLDGRELVKYLTSEERELFLSFLSSSP